MENEILEGRAILVTAVKSTSDLPEAQRSLDELCRLLDTAGGEEFARVIQVKESFDPRTCIGSGKVKEIRELASANGISLIVFDFELSPAQIRNLEEEMGDVRVIDRSMLILDIFARHAISGEGKLQVELAQLKYSAPRLMGKGKDLSRLGGGIGTRGPGESKLESDRRHLHERINTLERQLKELAHNRGVMRAARDKSGLTKIAIVGYTNAGKSTLLNHLTSAGVLSEDKLFATLDPTTRRLELPHGEEVLLTDTVGFIRKLPHHLIHAFRSTLDEVVYADMLLILSDVNDPEADEHIAVTEELLRDLGAEGKPVLYVYNKCDLLPDFPNSGIVYENKAYISADKGFGIENLLNMIEKKISDGKKKLALFFSYSDQKQLNFLHTDAVIESEEYREDGVYVVATLDAKAQGKYAAYVKE